MTRLLTLSCGFLLCLLPRVLTAEEPRQVKDVSVTAAAGANTQLESVAGTLFFSGTDGTNGVELWMSDGTEVGTVMVKDLSPGANSSWLGDFTAVGETLFFLYDDNLGAGLYGRELWKSDGTEAGTVLIKDIRSGTQSSLPRELIGVGQMLYFSADDGVNGRELWKSDGSEAGTIIVKDLQAVGDPDFSGDPECLAEWNGDLYFSAVTAANGREPWTSDGTEAGTTLIHELVPDLNGSDPCEFTGAGGSLFFRCQDTFQDKELCKTDGTSAGTMLVKDIRPGVFASSSPSDLVGVGDRLYFNAFHQDYGRELWTSDGTEAGTVLVKNINPGTASAITGGDSAAALGDQLLFKANDGTNGAELWTSDGTEAGTFMVKDINAGSSWSQPRHFVTSADALFFTAIETSTGEEAWKSDGSEAGTVRVTDIVAGTKSSTSFPVTLAGGLPFLAARGPSQFELTYRLWALPVDFGDAPDPSYPTLGASNGASHVRSPESLYLGLLVDSEATAQPTSAADGDDTDVTGDDEDGVDFTSSLLPGQSATLEVIASEAGVLNAWLDFNGDGDWADPGEQVFTDEALVAGTNSLSIAVPADAVLGASVARFRVNLTGGLAPTGIAGWGEVEDHAVTIGEAAGPTADAGADQTIAVSGETVTLGGSPAASGGVSPYTYQWSVTPPTGFILSSSAEANPSFTATIAGTYTVELEVTDSNSDVDTDTATIVAECPGTLNLADRTLDGTISHFEATTTLTAERVTITGNPVSFVAGQTLELRDGVVVGAGAGFEMGLDQSADCVP